MKGTFRFDPRDVDHGASTEAIRAILAEWMEIDWFEPSELSADHAAALFLQHQRLAHASAPAIFPREIDLRVVTGDRHEFTSWCHRVRGRTSWDWKFTALKQMSSLHAEARGWSPEAVAGGRPPASPRPGDLFFTFADTTGATHVVWNSVLSIPPALEALPREGFGDAARFYISYAHSDVLDCMKWQLADNSSDMSTNPFLPLLLCYQAGACPFSLDRDTVVLFRFDRTPGN